MPNPHPDPSAANGAAAARPRTAAEDKLWRALGAQPATTAGELATAAGIGRSTTAKILARWATAGLVTRTAATTAVGAALWLPWLIVAGIVLVLSAVSGLVFEYYLGPEKH